MNETAAKDRSDADALARRCAEALWSNDKASQALGMQIISVGEGHSEVRMVVREDMLSGHELVHGGIVFTLADSAFAFACNSHNQAAYAMSCTIDFVRPAVLGDELTARAEERSHTRSSGVYEITVSNQHDKVIAHFRGRSFTRGEPLIKPEEN